MAQDEHETLELQEQKRASGRVLIVDHDENALIALKTLLEEATYDTTKARSGQKALQLLCHGTFDLVLLDDNLLDEGGEEIVRQVRNVSRSAPVIVMQSMPLSADRSVRYARLGACFFTDRSDPATIAEHVHHYLSRTQCCCRF